MLGTPPNKEVHVRKILVCCATLGAFALASPSAYAGGHGHGGHGNNNGAHQDHTCQGGHNCNTTPPAPTPPPPAPPPVVAPPTTTTTNTTVNVTTNVINTVTAPTPASAPVVCNTGCAAGPPPATVVHHKKHKRCRTIRVKRYRKVWHSGYNNCGKLVRWYTYKKVIRKRRVCV